MERTHQAPKRLLSTELLLSTATGILFGLGIALLMLSCVLLLLDDNTASSITTILFGGSV